MSVLDSLNLCRTPLRREGRRRLSLVEPLTRLLRIFGVLVVLGAAKQEFVRCGRTPLSSRKGGASVRPSLTLVRKAPSPQDSDHC
jgi:hypothetical protein